MNHFCHWAAAKERLKTHCKLNKVCERYFLCQLSSVQPATNVHTVALHLPVGARLHQLGKTWASLGASTKVLRILREG